MGILNLKPNKQSYSGLSKDEVWKPESSSLDPQCFLSSLAAAYLWVHLTQTVLSIVDQLIDGSGWALCIHQMSSVQKTMGYIPEKAVV